MQSEIGFLFNHPTPPEFKMSPPNWGPQLILFSRLSAYHATNLVLLSHSAQFFHHMARRKAFQKKMPNKAEIRFRAKTIVTSLPRDIYSDRPKTVPQNKVSSKCNPYVIIVLPYRSICLSIRHSKMEGVPAKILGRNTLRWLPGVFTNNPSYLAYDTEGNLVTLSLRFGSRNSPLSLPM